MWTFTKVENGKPVISSSSFSDSMWKVDALDQLFLNFSMTKAPPNSISIGWGPPYQTHKQCCKDMWGLLADLQTVSRNVVLWSPQHSSNPPDGTLTVDVFVSLLKQRLSLWPVSLLGRNVTLCVTVKTVGMRWSVVRTYSFFSASSHL